MTNCDRSKFAFHPESEFATINVGHGREIAYKMTGSASPDLLIVCFHGAIDRKKVPLPRFQKVYSGGPHSTCLSICDPTLNVNDTLRLGWYSGSEDFPLRSILRSLLRNTGAHLNPKRAIFFGGSGGGYAALLYAKSIDGAVSLTINPQTDIRSYYSGHVRDYFSSCFPSIPEAERSNYTNFCDLAGEYQDNPQRITNVILSSAGDRHHFVHHVSRFVGRVGQDTRARMILWSDFLGAIGHGGSVTDTVIHRWFKAIAMADTTEPESILSAYHALAPIVTHHPSIKLPVEHHRKEGVNPNDLRIANLLRDYQQRQYTEGEI